MDRSGVKNRFRTVHPAMKVESSMVFRCTRAKALVRASKSAGLSSGEVAGSWPNSFVIRIIIKHLSINCGTLSNKNTKPEFIENRCKHIESNRINNYLFANVTSTI